jgi:hypothetical protein
MEMEGRESYVTPTVETVEVNAEGVICSSKDRYVPEVW